MIEWSERVRALPGYPLAEIPSIKRRLIESGRDVIDLGAGDSDTPPPAPVVEALREAVKDPALSKYGFQQGLPAFRQAASEHSKPHLRSPKNIGLVPPSSPRVSAPLKY